MQDAGSAGTLCCHWPLSFFPLPLPRGIVFTSSRSENLIFWDFCEKFAGLYSACGGWDAIAGYVINNIPRRPLDSSDRPTKVYILVYGSQYFPLIWIANMVGQLSNNSDVEPLERLIRSEFFLILVSFLFETQNSTRPVDSIPKFTYFYPSLLFAFTLSEVSAIDVERARFQCWRNGVFKFTTSIGA